MDGLVTWVGNILFFLIFLTIIENLLPGKKYVPYIRLFAGMALILLVTEPVTKGFRLEERIAYDVRSIAFRQDAKDLSKEILGVEKARLSQIMDRYEEAVEQEVDAMAKEMGYVPVSTRVTIEREEGDPAYGTVTHIEMKVGRQGAAKEAPEEQAVAVVNPVEPVEVNLGETEASPAHARGPESEGREPSQAGRQEEGRREAEAEPLKRKVERCYGLETGEVEIQFQAK